uniref:Uncharacterized protein n=1 Tax=viral metagenome TaxID=1070528 RepID=A0A6M3LVX2_9ZZZZ
MADYYYAIVTYHSGDKVRLVHKGKEPTPATMALLAPIGAFIEICEPLPSEKQGQYREVEEAHATACRVGWHPQMDVPESDDE